jgi:hypothetical protein
MLENPYLLGSKKLRRITPVPRLDHLWVASIGREALQKAPGRLRKYAVPG